MMRWCDEIILGMAEKDAKNDNKEDKNEDDGAEDVEHCVVVPLVQKLFIY